MLCSTLNINNIFVLYNYLGLSATLLFPFFIALPKPPAVVCPVNVHCPLLCAPEFRRVVKRDANGCPGCDCEMGMMLIQNNNYNSCLNN